MLCPGWHFYPRPPGGGRLKHTVPENIGYGISIHALRVEGDPVFMQFRHRNVFISIHALRVEGDRCCTRLLTSWQNFYPRPPGGGRPIATTCVKMIIAISIHALRVEGDARISLIGRPVCRISIHALRVEGDSKRVQHRHSLVNFYPRPPGGGRPAHRPERLAP